VILYKGTQGWAAGYEIRPEKILYEDNWLLFYAKEPGIPTQGTISDNYNNVYAALKRYLRKRASAAYAGLHHRLDSDTSGVLLFTKNKKANAAIHSQFKNRQVKKIYLALVHGMPDFKEKIFSGTIGKHRGKYYFKEKGQGKAAVTAFQFVAGYSDYALISAYPETGRTHQIRLQLAALGLPILGDPLYGRESGREVPRTMLHAHALTVRHPADRKELALTADLCEDMKTLVPDWRARLGATETNRE